MLVSIPFPYKCKACGHTFISFHYSGGIVLKNTQIRLTQCPKCGSTNCSITQGIIEKIKNVFK